MNLGINDILLAWFHGYLSNRTQSVVIKGEKSDAQYIDAGVPQGSALGPLLFQIYLNDIINNIASVVMLFADDTSMSLALRDPVLRGELLNADLEKKTTNDWVKTWKVKFNEDKTELLNTARDQTSYSNFKVYPS